MHDRSAKELPELKNGDTVRLQLRAGRPWTKAKVLRKVGIRSYKVVTESGAEFRDERDERENNRARQHDHENIRAETRETANVRRSTRRRQEPSYLKDYVTI